MRGSVVFSLGLVKDLCLTQELNGSHVCFMDINEDVLDVIYELGRRYAEDLSADMTFEKTTSRGGRVTGRRFCDQYGNGDAQ